MDKKVLIVEDDPLCRDMYVREFTNHGYTVSSALDGKEAIEKAFSENPEIILLDVMLPEKNGVEVLEEVRDREKKEGKKPVPIMVLSNLAQEDVYEQFKKMGIVKYVIKVEKQPKEIREEVEEIFNEGEPHNLT